MATFGRLRLDVENCVRELSDFGVVRRVPGTPRRASGHSGLLNHRVSALLDTFLERTRDD